MKRPVFLADFWARALLLALAFSLLAPLPARADVAPPEAPPGAGIAPGQELTQVRMVSERVTLTILPNREGEMPKARTEATFQMRNLGAVEEKMDARFPLVFGESIYYSEMFPEISDIQVKVDGKVVATRRQMGGYLDSETKIPWAVFPVAFPPGQDVHISVTYTTLGFGYEPHIVFRYILETGAGWKDTIGSAEIVVVLPYAASLENVVFDEYSGYGQTTLNPQFSGNEIRWRFESLEPTWEDNFTVMVIQPSAWQKVLREREAIARNPKDGEAWGRLGKAIKAVIRYPRGYLRADDAGRRMYLEAVAAYEKSVTLLPKDALWHYGFADLLWSHYVFDVHWTGGQDVAELARLCQELNTSLALDPKNQDARDLADTISYTIPGLIEQSGSGYTFLALTATPTAAPPTPTATQPPAETTFTPSPQPSPTWTLPPTVFVEGTEPLPAPQPDSAPGAPFCGGAALLLPLLAGLAWASSRLK